MDEKKMDLSNLLGALRVNSLKAAISSAPMEKREKKKLVIPDSLRKTEAYLVFASSSIKIKDLF